MSSLRSKSKLTLRNRNGKSFKKGVSCCLVLKPWEVYENLWPEPSGLALAQTLTVQSLDPLMTVDCVLSTDISRSSAILFLVPSTTPSSSSMFAETPVTVNTEGQQRDDREIQRGGGKKIVNRDRLGFERM